MSHLGTDTRYLIEHRRKKRVHRVLMLQKTFQWWLCSDVGEIIVKKQKKKIEKKTDD